MQILVDALPVNLQNGDNETAPVNVPDGLTDFDFRLERDTAVTPASWPSVSTLLWFNVYISFDGGATWEFQAGTGERANGGGGIAGGIVKLRDGTDRPFQSINATGCRLGLGRKIKSTLSVQGGPLVSKLTVIVQ